MPGNHLEDLVAEWYLYQGFFVRRNVQVGKRPQGGYQCELDIVAYHPGSLQLLHVEPSLDTQSWDQREKRYAKKFTAGLKFIPGLFPSVPNLPPPQQVALFVYGGRGARKTIAGGSIMFIKDLMLEILPVVSQHRLQASAIPEQYPLLRTLQFAAQFWPIGPSDAA